MTTTRYIKGILTDSGTYDLSGTEQKSSRIKARAKEVLKSSVKGMITGGTIAFSIGGAVAELFVLSAYRQAICKFSYANPPEYQCSVVSCDHGNPVLQCEISPRSNITIGKIINSGMQAGRAAHHNWWQYGGEALLLTLTTGGIIFGGVVGGTIGFFNHIQTPTEIAAREEKLKRTAALYEVEELEWSCLCSRV